MFEPDFYPTPPDLIRILLSDLKVDRDDAILEPSAGKGDLAMAIKKKCNEENRYWNEDLDVLEINEELRAILKSKGFRVVGNDFLSYDTRKKYDAIYANFPFSLGEKHLDKALHMLKPGGYCACILNAETIDNPHTHLRKTLVDKLKKWGAEFTYISDAFKSAERKSGVRIVIIKVRKPTKKEQVSILLDLLVRDAEIEEKENSTEVARRNWLIQNDEIQAMIARFRVEIRAGLLLLDAHEDLRPYILDRFEDPTERFGVNPSPVLKVTVGDKETDSMKNRYIRLIRKKYWEALFSKGSYTAKLTSGLITELHNRVDELQHYEFNEENILALNKELGVKLFASIEDTIDRLFEKLSYEHHWNSENSKNIHYYNGWSTNKSWYINKKVIQPIDAYSRYTSTVSYNPDHSRTTQELRDIEVCLGFLNKGIESWVSQDTILHRAYQTKQTKGIKLRYISVDFFKKGTTHITFLDEDLLRKLNIYGSRKRKWLPPCYGKKRYKDLTPKERKVVDEFEKGVHRAKDRDMKTYKNGEEYYEEVCNRPELIIETENTLPLLGFSVPGEIATLPPSDPVVEETPPILAITEEECINVESQPVKPSRKKPKQRLFDFQSRS